MTGWLGTVRPLRRVLAEAAAVSLVLAAGTGAIDIAPLSMLAGQAQAQQSGGPGGSGNQGTSTGPGSTARTSNQNRANTGGGGGNGGGNGGGGTGGVPVPTASSGEASSGGMTTRHDMTTSIEIKPGWCDDVGPEGVDDAMRMEGRNLARIEAAMAHVGGAPDGLSATSRRGLFAAYQRAMEAQPRKLAMATEALAGATTVAVEAVTVADVNALLCVGASADEVGEIVAATHMKQAGAGK